MREDRSGFPTRARLGTALARNNALILVEILLFLVILAAGFAGLIPFSATPALFLFGWLSLWLRGKGWSEYGLKRPTLWMVLLGIGFGIAYQFFSLHFIDPVLARWSGKLPDVSQFASLVGNGKQLAFWLLISWTLAAFGEEFIYRGYLLNRLAEVGKKTSAAWGASLMLSSLLFGLGHIYQGATGVAATALASLVTGALYLAARRNLWVVILMHGVGDTVGFLLIFFGKYPGM